MTAAEGVTPADWPDSWEPELPGEAGRGWTRFGAFLGGVGLIAGLPAMVTGQNPGTLVVAGVAVIAGLSALGLGLSLAPVPARVELVNAVALTTVTNAPDSWVHLVRARKRTGLLTTMTLVSGVAIGAVAVVAIVLALTSSPTPQQLVGLIAAIVLCAVVSAGVVALGVVHFRQWYRGRSFGRVPAGLAVGPTAILLTGGGDAEVIRWDDIVELDAQQWEPQVRGRALPSIPTIVIQTRRAVRSRDSQGRPTGEPRRRVDVPVGSYAATPAGMWALVATPFSEPNARRLLGTADGQRLLEGWIGRTPETD